MKLRHLFFCIINLLIACTFTPVLAQGPGTAINLNGSYDHVEFSNDDRGVVNQVTVEAWIKTTSFEYKWVVGKYNRGSYQNLNGDNGYHLIIQNGKAAFNGRDGSGQYKSSGFAPISVNDNKWHHLTGVCEKGVWQIYVDGVLGSETRASNPLANLRNNMPLAIGKYYLNNENFFTGTIDEVRVWKRALTEEEIRTNMCKTIPDNSPDLVAYFKMDEATGSTVKDYSTYKLNGTFRNINPASAWVTSGAAIGDKSVYLYPVNWQGQKVEMATSDGGKIWVDKVGSTNSPGGIQLYYVGSRPNSTSGISNPQSVTDYYGVFPALTTSQKFNLNYTQYKSLCKATFFARTDNAILSWSEQPTTISGDTAFTVTNGTRKEFVVQSQHKQKLTITGPEVICTGSTIELEVNTDLSPTWSNGMPGKKITVTKAGKYWATVTDGSCTSSDTIVVEEQALPVVSLGNDISLCPEASATIQAPAGFAAYKWNTGAETAAITVTAAGTYWVDVTNAGGCTARSSIEVQVVGSAPAIALPDNQRYTICYGETVTINASTEGASYKWSNGSTASTVTAANAGELWVDIMVNDCTYRRNVLVETEDCPFVPNIITPNGDGLNDTFTVKGLSTDKLQVEIYSRWGKLVYKTDSYNNSWNAAEVTKGTYYYYIKSGQSGKEYKGWLEVVK